MNRRPKGYLSLKQLLFFAVVAIALFLTLAPFFRRASIAGTRTKALSGCKALSKGRSSLFQTGSDSLFGNQIPNLKLPTRRF